MISSQHLYVWGVVPGARESHSLSLYRLKSGSDQGCRANTTSGEVSARSNTLLQLMLAQKRPNPASCVLTPFLHCSNTRIGVQTPQNKHQERNSAARHGFLSRKKSCSTPFLGSRLSLEAQEAMSPIAVELGDIVLTPVYSSCL